MDSLKLRTRKRRNHRKLFLFLTWLTLQLWMSLQISKLTNLLKLLMRRKITLFFLTLFRYKLKDRKNNLQRNWQEVKNLKIVTMMTGICDWYYKTTVIINKNIHILILIQKNKIKTINFSLILFVIKNLLYLLIKF